MDVNLRGIVLHAAARAARHGGAAPRPDHQPHQPGRRAPVAAVSGLLGVQGGGRQAHREPRPRDRRHGISVFSVHPGLLPIGMTDTLAAHRALNPLRGRTSALGARASSGRAAAPTRSGRSSCSCGWPPATPTPSRAATCRCTTTSTPCSPTCPRYCGTTSMSCVRSACARDVERSSVTAPARLTRYWDSQIMASRSGSSSRTLVADGQVGEGL